MVREEEEKRVVDCSFIFYIIKLTVEEYFRISGLDSREWMRTRGEKEKERDKCLNWFTLRDRSKSIVES
jgi:hypothetical protein